MNDYKSYICSNCGGPLELKDNVYVCKSCGSTFPSSVLQKKAFVDLQLAKKEIQSANFSKAKKILNKIVSDTQDDLICDVYWNLMLASNYVMFETDGKGEQFPSFFNISNTNILEDENYKLAIDSAQKIDDYDKMEIYSKLAQKIEDARKKYLDISQKTKPFDIFICFKSSDTNGKDTKDKQLAMDLYNEFNGKYNVFFSEKTLTNIKSNCREYEPNIYYGLYTSKVMLLLCSKKEYIESTWLKNEWSRFEKINSNGSKTIIPIFIDDFDPSSLPQELWHKQGIKNDINLIQTLTNQFDDLLKSQEEIDRLNALKKQQTKKKIITGSIVSLACVLIVFGVILLSLQKKDNAAIVYKKVNDTYVIVKTNPEKLGEELIIEQFYNDTLVTGIESNAFKNLSNVKKLVLPNTIEKIAFNAFDGLNNIETIKIPFIGSNANDETNSYLGYFFGATNYDKNQTTVPASLKSITITNDPVISTNTFYGLDKIQEVIISGVTTTIEKSAFDSSNTSLNTLEIPFIGKNITSYETGSASKVGATEIFGYIFGATEYSKQELKIPNSLKTLKITKQEVFGSYSLYKCINIKTIYIPNTTTKMCVSAFNACNNITQIYYGGQIKDWLKIDFVSEKSHPFFSYSDTITTRKFYEFINNEYRLVENVTIDSNDTQGFSLYDIDSLKTITITKDVTYLEKGFFDGITSIYNLSNIIFESKENWSVYSTTDKSNITQITIPSNFNELKTLIEQYSSYYWEKVN